MTSKDLPRLIEFVSYGHALFSTVCNGSCSNFGHACAKYLTDHPVKRARESEGNAIQAGSSKTVGLFNRARLSKLLVLSLDILSEIFSCLHPSDLVSLSRVNKYFRSLLLSRRSSVLWDTCFKLCGAPISPADVPPQAWAHLLFGGTYCYSCGAKPEDTILFSLRRRACKSCMVAHLVCSSNVQQGFRDMIRFELGYAGSIIYQEMPCCTRHWWDEDVVAFEAELNSLQVKHRVGASEGGISDVGFNIPAFLERKKEEVKANREHALVCAEWDKDRFASRGSESKPSDARFNCFKEQAIHPFSGQMRPSLTWTLDSIKSRFLQLGYSESVVDQLRPSREVRVGSGESMSDRVWRRVDPPLSPIVDEVMDLCTSLDEERGYSLDGSLTHDPLQVVMQANSRRQGLVATQLDPMAHYSCQLPTGSRDGGFALRDGVMQASSEDQVTRFDAPGYQLAGGSRDLEGNVSPDYDHPQFFIGVDSGSRDHIALLNAPSYPSPINGAPKASESQYSTLANALSLSVAPTQSQDSDDQVNTQPEETATYLPYECPVCQDTFLRAQERNRHVESYLPHSIFCPFQDCNWTGRRQWDFKKHWKKSHPYSGRAPKKTNEIYDPKKFVKSIVDGTPRAKVVQSVCLMVQERLEKLGKVDVGVNVWGRKGKMGN